MTEIKINDTKLNAAWLIGCSFAYEQRGFPKRIRNKKAFKRAVKTASDILDDGAFNPIEVYEMNKIIRQIRGEL